MRRASTRRILSPMTVTLALAVLGGCATAEDPDSGWMVSDARNDATTDAVSMDARDAVADTNRTDAMDVPRDTSRDVQPDRVDTGVDVPRDTGGGACPSVCSTNTDCQNMCPAAGIGYLNCCLEGSGGGTCFQYMGSTCPTGPTDGGTSGSDSGIPLGGGPGSPCSADGQCSMGSTCCLQFTPGFGVCGCSTPFGCIPPSGGSC